MAQRSGPQYLITVDCSVQVDELWWRHRTELF